jgi:hypothetical protein
MNVMKFVRRLIASRDNSPDAILRKTLNDCPVCGEDLKGHLYCQAATVRADDPASRDGAMHAAARGEWQRLVAFQQWNSEADIIEFGAVVCNRRGEVGLVTILYTAEMWSDDRLIDRRLLSSAEGQELRKLVDDRCQLL